MFSCFFISFLWTSKETIIFQMWQMKILEINGMLFPKQYLNGRDKSWTSFGFLVPKPVLILWHHVSLHTQTYSLERLKGIPVFSLVRWSWLLFTTVLCHYLWSRWCIVSDDLWKLWPIKILSSSLSLIPLHWAKLSPSAILPNSFRNHLKHQFFSFLFVSVSFPDPSISGWSFRWS